MEDKLNLILNKLENIEDYLSNYYRIKNFDESINEFLSDKDSKTFIGVNTNMIYEIYCKSTTKPASSKRLNAAIKSKFNLKIKHTTKNKQNIYYWSE